MEDIHQFYIVNRAIYLVASAAILLGFAVSLYRDRYVLTNKNELAKWPSKTVVRISGAIGSFMFFFTQIDYFGAFGIFSTLLRFIVLEIQLLCWWIALLVPCYHAVVVSLAFWPGDDVYQRRETIVRRIFWVLGSLLYLAANLGLFVTDSVITIASLSFSALVLTFVIVCVHYVHFQLRGFLNEVITDDGRGQDLINAVRTWLKYSIAVTIILGLMGWIQIPMSIARIVRVLRGAPRNGGAFPVTPCCVPSAVRIIIQAVYVLVFALILWRSWLGKDGSDAAQRARRKHTDGSSSAKTKKGSTVTKNPSRGSVAQGRMVAKDAVAEEVNATKV